MALAAFSPRILPSAADAAPACAPAKSMPAAARPAARVKRRRLGEVKCAMWPFGGEVMRRGEADLIALTTRRRAADDHSSATGQRPLDVSGSGQSQFGRFVAAWRTR